MKKILVVYTGGTICSFHEGQSRVLRVDSAKRVIVDNFSRGSSGYAKQAHCLFEDSGLKNNTLSENMTLEKLSDIVENIRSFDMNMYAGVIVLHGTDTLAYTAAILSMVLHNTKVPVMLVSADRPADDPLTNANDNFQAAAELILEGIAPNVYVPYRNSDGRMWLHLGATLMQSANFTDDFYNGACDRVFLISGQSRSALFEKCLFFSKKREQAKYNLLSDFNRFKDSVRYLKPYVGIDYGLVSLEGIEAVIHGTFHTGTLCVGRNTPEEPFGRESVLFLAEKCRQADIPLYIAPCLLHSGQYSSAYDAVKNGGLIPLNMVTDSAYAKLLVGSACGLSGDALKEYMAEEINSEML